MLNFIGRPSLATVALSIIVVAAARGDDCSLVRGHLFNRPVVENCDSPTFCAAGELLGRLNGEFTQKGVGFAPAGAVLGDPEIPPSIILGSADILLETKFCGGVLKLKDTFVINFSPPDSANLSGAFFSAVHTVDSQMSTGGCFGATGQLKVQGVSTPAGVDADYEGVICK